MSNKRVLYAEDDENDAYFMERAFTEMGARGDLRVVCNGELATEYLAGTGAFGSRAEFPVPDVLLLDVKMPEMSGLEVLSWVRSRPEFKRLTVVMFTSSTQPADVEYCAAHGADAYLVKPSQADHLSEFMPQVLAARMTEVEGGRRLEIPGNLLPALGRGKR